MTHYVLSTKWDEGWVPVPITGDDNKFRKIFADQAAGRPQSNQFPLKDTMEKKEPKVVVKLVTDVQDAVDQAKLLMKYKRLKEKKKTAGGQYDYAYGSISGQQGRKMNF